MKTNITSPQPYRYLPFSRVSFRVIAWAVLTGLAIALPVIYLTHLLPLPQTDPHAATIRLANLPSWMLVLQAVVIYPFFEECIYRGLILQLLRRYLSLWLAVSVPTIFFAVTHLGFSVQNAIFAGVVGLYFAWLAIRSGSLLPSIFCHAAINLFVVFVLRAIFPGSADATAADLHQPLALALLSGSLVVFVLGARYLTREFSQQPATLAAA